MKKSCIALFPSILFSGSTFPSYIESGHANPSKATQYEVGVNTDVNIPETLEELLLSGAAEGGQPEDTTEVFMIRRPLAKKIIRLTEDLKTSEEERAKMEKEMSQLRSANSTMEKETQTLDEPFEEKIKSLEERIERLTISGELFRQEIESLIAEPTDEEKGCEKAEKKKEDEFSAMLEQRKFDHESKAERCKEEMEDYRKVVASVKKAIKRLKKTIKGRDNQLQEIMEEKRKIQEESKKEISYKDKCLRLFARQNEKLSRRLSDAEFKHTFKTKASLKLKKEVAKRKANAKPMKETNDRRVRARAIHSVGGAFAEGEASDGLSFSRPYPKCIRWALMSRIRVFKVPLLVRGVMPFREEITSYPSDLDDLTKTSTQGEDLLKNLRGGDVENAIMTFNTGYNGILERAKLAGLDDIENPHRRRRKRWKLLPTIPEGILQDPSPTAIEQLRPKARWNEISESRESALKDFLQAHHEGKLVDMTVALVRVSFFAVLEIFDNSRSMIMSKWSWLSYSIFGS